MLKNGKRIKKRNNFDKFHFTWLFFECLLKNYALWSLFSLSYENSTRFFFHSSFCCFVFCVEYGHFAEHNCSRISLHSPPWEFDLYIKKNIINFLFALLSFQSHPICSFFNSNKLDFFHPTKQEINSKQEREADSVLRSCEIFCYFCFKFFPIIWNLFMVFFSRIRSFFSLLLTIFRAYFTIISTFFKDGKKSRGEKRENFNNKNSEIPQKPINNFFSIRFIISVVWIDDGEAIFNIKKFIRLSFWVDWKK